jgi:hypothetical protein
LEILLKIFAAFQGFGCSDWQKPCWKATAVVFENCFGNLFLKHGMV